jgi:hypothetical protein
LEDKTCLFCNEAESSKHLFFDCCVAHYMWGVISDMLGLPVFSDFETMGTWWLKVKKHNIVNVLSSVVLWALWKKRNNICFQGERWTGMIEVMRSCARLLKNWKLVNNQDDAARLEGWACELEKRGRSPPALGWRMGWTSFSWGEERLDQRSQPSESLGSDRQENPDEELMMNNAEEWVNELLCEDSVSLLTERVASSVNWDQNVENVVPSTEVSVPERCCTMISFSE